MGRGCSTELSVTRSQDARALQASLRGRQNALTPSWGFGVTNRPARLSRPGRLGAGKRGACAGRGALSGGSGGLVTALELNYRIRVAVPEAHPLLACHCCASPGALRQRVAEYGAGPAPSAPTATRHD